MRVFLIGYEGSQKIVPASKYLTDKYLPKSEFDVMYLNHKGGPKEWTKHIATFLSFFNDEYIIFALDDYLVAGFDEELYRSALKELGGDVVCIKLCPSTEQEHLEYPVTTQYSIWNREYLISLLNIPPIDTPWEFEIEGSRHYFKKTCLHRPCIDYFANSSISGRWGGIKLDGLNKEDSDYIISNLLPVGTAYHKTGEFTGTTGKLKLNEKPNGFI